MSEDSEAALAFLEGVIKLARQYGCNSLKMGDIAITFESRPPTKEEDATRAQDYAQAVKALEMSVDADCACGHLLEIEHNPAGCLLGCDPKICAGPGKETVQ